MNKVYVLPPNENWIVDRFVKEFNEDNPDIIVKDPRDADVIWLLSDWCWERPYRCGYLAGKKVLTTVHHIVPEKFGSYERVDFQRRDSVTTAYHVYNQRTLEFIRPVTNKPIYLVKYWANDVIWRPTGTKRELREKHGLPVDAFIIGSFQRDTEGRDLVSPKLEKGPDLLADFIEFEWENWKCTDLRLARKPQKPHVLLAGWRRQYIIKRLEQAGIPYTYVELPSQEVVNELYQTLDLYPVTARHEGGPQSLIECGLLNVPCVSTPVGIAEQVLPATAISADIALATPAVPNVTDIRLPKGYKKYRSLFANI